MKISPVSWENLIKTQFFISLAAKVEEDEHLLVPTIKDQ